MFIVLVVGLDSLDLATKGAGGYLHPSAVRRNLNYLNYFLFVVFLVGMMISNGYALSKLCAFILRKWIYILVGTMCYSPCRGRRWSAECCWFKVVEVVDFYILLPRQEVDWRGIC